jgi:hypothetical protein
MDGVVPELEGGTVRVPRWLIQVIFGYAVLFSVGVFCFAWNANGSLHEIQSQLNEYTRQGDRTREQLDKFDNRLRSLEATRRGVRKGGEE